jgi:electron transfer flavoprotein beta subunit
VRLVVCVKQVPDSEAKVKVAAEGLSISEQDITFVINPYDEYALEEAVRISGRLGEESEVLLLSVGPPRVAEALRRGLAAGGTLASRIWGESVEQADGALVARLLAAALEHVGYDLVLCGRLAIDDGAGEIGGRVAELLGIPHATAVSMLGVEGGRVVAHREVDGGVEIVELPLPAVITAQRGLNEPRYPAIPAIIKARRLPVDELTPETLSLDSGDVSGLARSRIVSLTALESARKRRRLEGEPTETARELARLLRDDAKAL